MRWYKNQTQWSEGHSYADPAVTTAALRAWFEEIRSEFPPLNGPMASDDCDNPKVTDHCIGRHVIYSAFRWPVAESAYLTVRELAMKHRVGFYDVSGAEGEILLPPGA
jgi:hypothetical protein